MSSAYNKVLLMGNLTRDPELRVTPAGHQICKLSLAVNRTYTTQDGQKRDEVTYVDVDAFGRQAEIISKYFTKGRPIFLEGRLRLDQWEDKTTGEKRSRLGVVLEGFQFIGGRGDGSEGGSSSAYEESSPPARPAGSAQPASGSAVAGGSGARPAPRPDNSLDDDDVPF